jgi:predicted RNase H-like nuclease
VGDAPSRRHHDRRARALPRDVRRLIAGVDGCRGGWAVALAAVDVDADVDVVVVPTFAAVLALRPIAIAVDMPIGLYESGRRACDVEARRQLGPRRSSVFPAPTRPMLEAETYAEALAIAGLPKQAYHLLPKIREVDALMTPHRQRTIAEAHPELCFALLLGAPCRYPKRTALGRAERIAALGGEIAPPPRGAAWDDVLDARALLVTARRIALGTAERFGDDAPDATGLRALIAL